MKNAVFAINENTCIECGQCRRYCPIAGAIIIDEHYQHTVVADICTGCGVCEAFCPVPNTLYRVDDGPQQAAERLAVLRETVWRGQWGYHRHPVMGPLTMFARHKLSESNRAIRARRRADMRVHQQSAAN